MGRPAWTEAQERACRRRARAVELCSAGGTHGAGGEPASLPDAVDLERTRQSGLDRKVDSAAAGAARNGARRPPGLIARSGANVKRPCTVLKSFGYYQRTIPSVIDGRRVDRLA